MVEFIWRCSREADPDAVAAEQPSKPPGNRAAESVFGWCIVFPRTTAPGQSRARRASPLDEFGGLTMYICTYHLIKPSRSPPLLLSLSKSSFAPSPVG